MQNLKDKHILILGAAGGFGRAVVEKIAPSGARLTLGDLDTAALEPVAARAAELGAPDVKTGTLNVTDESDVAAFFEQVKAGGHPADMLLYLPGMSIASPVTAMAEADYDRIVDVNLKGLFLAAKYFLPLTVPERNPLFAFISSQAATRANPNAPVYCAAKAAVSMFGQGLALQAMQNNVRVTAFKPGPVDTQGFWGNRPVPREKFLQAADVAEVIAFTLSLPPHVVMHEVSFESFDFFKK